jgi:hypothetical protein
VKAFHVAMLVTGLCGSAQAGESRVDQRISIFAGLLHGELMRACSGCGCRGGGGTPTKSARCSTYVSVMNVASTARV